MSNEKLPIREITLDGADLQELNRNPWSKIFKNAELKMDERTYSTQFGLRGGHTRNYLKKSFEVRLPNKRTLHWNAEFDDPSMMRNALSFYFFNRIGLHSPRTKHFWLIINGVDQGVYLELEAVDHHFFTARSIPYRSLIYAVNDSANFSMLDPITKKSKSSLFDGYELRDGRPDYTKKKLTSFIQQLNRRRGIELQAVIARKLDIPQYLLWLAGAVLTGNYDGFDQNYSIYEHRSSGKYRMIPWDYEGTWGRNCYGKPCGSDLVRLQGYNRLTKRLLSYSSIRKLYRRIIRKQLQLAFTSERLDPVIDHMHEQLAPAIRSDYTRKVSYDAFLEERAFIKQYVIERRALIKEALIDWKS